MRIGTDVDFEIAHVDEGRKDGWKDGSPGVEVTSGWKSEGPEM